MKFYSEDEAIDKVIGEKGTQSRMEFDAGMNEFLVGEAIRQARNLAQEQLGELVGVKKAQISKIENGSNVTLIAPRRYGKTGLIRNVFHYLPKNTRTSRGTSSSNPASPSPPRHSMRSIHASAASLGMCSAS